MTLIQTVVTDDVVIQVSDRRLTWPDGTLETDEYTKLIYWNGYFTVGFTGIARIDPQATESVSEWIAKTVSDYDNDEGIRALADDANSRIKTIPWEDKRLTIIFAGFAPVDGQERPVVVVVSNMKPDGTSDDQDTFHIFNSTPKVRPWHTAVGAPMNPLQHRVLRNRIPRVLKQQRGVERALTLMVALQRQVADAQEKRRKWDPTKAVTVGQDALCVVIPREQISPGTIMTNVANNQISSKSASFAFFPEGGFDFVKHGPLISGGGWVQTDLKAEANPSNPDHHGVGIRILKKPGDD